MNSLRVDHGFVSLCFIGSFTTWLRVLLNSQPSCTFLPRAGMTHVHHSTQQSYDEIGFVTRFTEKRLSINSDGLLRTEDEVLVKHLSPSSLHLLSRKKQKSKELEPLAEGRRCSPGVKPEVIQD